MTRPRPNSDGRPRIHIWPTRDEARYSFGPTGFRHTAISPGHALDMALESIGNVPAVIIYEPDTSEFRQPKPCLPP